MRQIRMELLGVLAVVALAMPALAGANIGDKPKIDFTTLDGKQVTSEMLKGRVVVVDFWATWCGSCVASMPHLKDLYEKYSPMGVVVLGISRDSDKQRLEKFISLVFLLILAVLQVEQLQQSRVPARLLFRSQRNATVSCSSSFCGLERLNKCNNLVFPLVYAV